MTDFLTALGLMCVLEGALYALFPDGMRGMMQRAILLPSAHLRVAGLSLAILGFLSLALLRGF